MKRALFLAFVLAGAAAGQQFTTTAPQQIITNGTAADIVTSPVGNVGQPYHLVYVVFSDQSGKTCGSGGWQGASVGLNVNGVYSEIEASWDGTHYQPITQTIRPVNTLASFSAGFDRYRLMVAASGSYPYLRLEVASYDNTNCQVNAWYTGSATAIDIRKTAVYGFRDTLIEGTFQSTAATTTSIAAQCGSNANPNARPVVYEFVLFSAAGQDMTIQETQLDTGLRTIMTLKNFSGVFVLPNTGLPHFRGAPGGALQVVTTAATAVSGYSLCRNE